MDEKIEEQKSELSKIQQQVSGRPNNGARQFLPRANAVDLCTRSWKTGLMWRKDLWAEN